MIVVNQKELEKRQGKRADAIFHKIVEIQRATGLDYHAAWDRVKLMHPELFADIPLHEIATYKRESDGKVEKLPDLRARACRMVVEAIRSNHPNMSFEDAWQVAAANAPGLYGRAVEEAL